MSKMNKYDQIILWIFERHYKNRGKSFEFERDEINDAADELGFERVKNLGDLIYSYRFRKELPEEIRNKAPNGLEWIIRLAGHGRYRFSLSKFNRIVPAEGRFEIKIPDSTPEIINRYALDDEQALLAKIRYNRLVDIFLGVTAYSLQSHLRTTVPDVGQVETDEIYVGVRKNGEQFVIPVQAKGGSDKLGVVQIEQDYYLCRHKYPALTPKLVAVQFIGGQRDRIVMFEVILEEDDLRILDERHYRLVLASDISDTELSEMASR